MGQLGHLGEDLLAGAAVLLPLMRRVQLPSDALYPLRTLAVAGVSTLLVKWPMGMQILGIAGALAGIPAEALESALRACEFEEWSGACSLWIYRGKEKPLEPHEIDMAVLRFFGIGHQPVRAVKYRYHQRHAALLKVL